MTTSCQFESSCYLLAGSILAVVVLVASAACAPGKAGNGWWKLAVDEEGAAYSLSYVLTMPIYLLLVCLIIQVAIIMTVKLGTTYAAFAAARSYAVWLPSNPSLADQKAQQATAQVMAAFSGGNKSSGGGGGLTGAYQEYSNNETSRVSTSYVGRNLGYAQSAAQVSLDAAPAAWDGDVKVTVTYDMPFAIPAVGRILGASRSGSGYVKSIKSQATVQVEGAKGKAIGDPNSLGIRYDPGEL